jgi:predicted DNA-binding protein (UPF0251 family)
MPRLQKNRIVNQSPLFKSFKPAGFTDRELEQLCLSIDEYEAVRLADLLGLDHIEAANMMEISRSTFSRLVERARRKVARFLVEGKQLNIYGGRVHFYGNRLKCNDCGCTFASNFGDSKRNCFIDFR